MNDKELGGKVIDFRRYLHRIPETGNNLPKTRAFLETHLEALDCEIRDFGPEGFTAWFECAEDKAAPCIAFRTDMDALPITEDTGLEFASEHQGCMHACGHDGHMGILLGLASWIDGNMGKLAKNVLLVFQASEETTGGARDLIAEGIFEEHRPERIYGLHLWPGYPLGVIASKPGGIMAGTCLARITAKGRSAHIANFKEGRDALYAASLFLNRAYEWGQGIQGKAPHLLRFGAFHSGTANNVVAGLALLEGTVRSYADETSDMVKDGMKRIAGEIEQETEVSFDFYFESGYPPVVNDPEAYAEAKARLISEGFSWFEMTEAALYAEDFAFYQQEIPGVYFHLGTGIDAELHTTDYMIDEDALLTGVRLFRSLIF
ncbi:MAG: amidohydrolase [Clostridiales Family XIII bacterium]|jgi:hippurate hydrolase|nr:amidohydrolase [Clostridiales Family XIII bacterium]